MSSGNLKTRHVSHAQYSLSKPIPSDWKIAPVLASQVLEWAKGQVDVLWVARYTAVDELGLDRLAAVGDGDHLAAEGIVVWVGHSLGIECGVGDSEDVLAVAMELTASTLDSQYNSFPPMKCKSLELEGKSSVCANWKQG